MAMSLDSIVKAPAGTKLWILNLGYLEADDAWFKQAGNISTKSNPNPTNSRRKLQMYAVLLDHPKEGLILWETGAGKDYPDVVGAPVNDIFARIEHEDAYDLPAAIEKTGHSIKDVKMVIMGHLHLDHAGGLKEFEGTGIPILTHELELKNAFYSVATQSDLGVYMPHYLNFNITWKTYRGKHLSIGQGVTLHHTPGHTPGLSVLQINLPDSGTWIFTSDHFLVKENYHDSTPQGFLARDHDDWIHSSQEIKQLVRRTEANVVFGHCLETLSQFKMSPHAYT